VTGVGSCSVGAACSSMKRLFPSKSDEEVTVVGSCSVGAACSSMKRLFPSKFDEDVRLWVPKIFEKIHY
jgi:hypothetical protein